MELVIVTSTSSEVEVSLKKGDEVILKEKMETKFGSQTLLPLIMKVLKDSSVDFKDIKEIKLDTGPGSFTGLRVGAAVANALGYSLGIPVNGKKIETDLRYT